MAEAESREQELFRLLGERDRQILDLKNGFEGCCSACEPVGSLNQDLALQVKAKEQEIARLKEELASVQRQLGLSEFRKESYIKDSWRCSAERDEARREVCALLAEKSAAEETPQAIAEKRHWSCFDKVMANSQYMAEVRGKELDRRNEIADEILGSEPFMWLMVGANHGDQHLRDLRPAWTAWINAGGKSYGKRR